MGLWAVLPIALRVVLRELDPLTITWLRFLFAAMAMAALLGGRGRLGPLLRLGRSGVLLLATATGFLAANYIAYLFGLSLTNASSAQVLMQLAPLLLALGGILVFRERFSLLQWLGFGVLCVGLAVFFLDQLRALLAEADRYLRGTGLLALASVTWAIYGMAQKQLLQQLSSQQIMLGIYAGCALLFAPFAAPLSLGGLGAPELAALAFCSVNTVVAYGAFSEALVHWEASRVSSVLALTPLGTLALVEAGSRLAPGWVAAEPLSWVSLSGAAVVVAGSLLVALGGHAPEARPA